MYSMPSVHKAVGLMVLGGRIQMVDQCYELIRENNIDPGLLATDCSKRLICEGYSG